MSKKEWNAAVLGGCVLGTVIAVGAWGVALGLAALGRKVPTAEWFGAAAMLALMVCLCVIVLRWERRMGADSTERR